MNYCLTTDWLFWASQAAFWHSMFNLLMSIVLCGLALWVRSLSRQNLKMAEKLAERLRS